VAERPFSNFSEALNRAWEIGSSSTILFYLDPYGIKDLEFDVVRQIYERDSRRSTEVLINFSFRTFMRMSGNWNYGDSASEITQKVKVAKIETVDRVMGGDYWRKIITDPGLSITEREDAVVDAYRDRLREFFKYSYGIPVKERREEKYKVPEDDIARYHLIFASRSARAIVYMNDVALNALKPYFNQFTDGLLFDMTPERYQSAERQTVKEAIVDAVRSAPLKRPEIYEAVIPRFFMHYWRKDLAAMIQELTFQEGRLYPDERAMKRKGQLNNDTLLSMRPWPRRG
jgi:hypothetical protein